VRDDGSTDGTVAAVQALRDDRITLSREPNVGFGRSFLMLLAGVPPEADMVMFADQDDLWLPGKIARAWQSLQTFGDRPALYGSAQMLADAQLRPLHATRHWTHAPSFEGALVENMITGCTAALNQPALRLLQRAGVPQGVHFHDWWLYLVVSAFGHVVYDPEPTLLYRQHGANQIGHGVGVLGRQLSMARFLLRRDWVGILLGQLHAFWRHYADDLPPARRRIVEPNFRICDRGAAPRWRFILGASRWRDTTEAVFRVLLALHRLHLWPPPGRRLPLEAPTTADTALVDDALERGSKHPAHVDGAA
jgi:glycosyltransferase involved in cell wall biosynthesis